MRHLRWATVIMSFLLFNQKVYASALLRRTLPQIGKHALRFGNKLKPHAQNPSGNLTNYKITNFGTAARPNTEAEITTPNIFSPTVVKPIPVLFKAIAKDPTILAQYFDDSALVGKAEKALSDLLDPHHVSEEFIKSFEVVCRNKPEALTKRHYLKIIKYCPKILLPIYMKNIYNFHPRLAISKAIDEIKNEFYNLIINYGNSTCFRYLFFDCSRNFYLNLLKDMPPHKKMQGFDILINSNLGKISYENSHIISEKIGLKTSDFLIYQLFFKPEEERLLEIENLEQILSHDLEIDKPTISVRKRIKATKNALEQLKKQQTAFKEETNHDYMFRRIIKRAAWLEDLRDRGKLHVDNNYIIQNFGALFLEIAKYRDPQSIPTIESIFEEAILNMDSFLGKNRLIQIKNTHKMFPQIKNLIFWKLGFTHIELWNQLDSKVETSRSAINELTKTIIAASNYNIPFDILGKKVEIYLNEKITTSNKLNLEMLSVQEQIIESLSFYSFAQKLIGPRVWELNNFQIKEEIYEMLLPDHLIEDYKNFMADKKDPFAFLRLIKLSLMTNKQDCLDFLNSVLSSDFRQTRMHTPQILSVFKEKEEQRQEWITGDSRPLIELIDDLFIRKQYQNFIIEDTDHWEDFLVMGHNLGSCFDLYDEGCHAYKIANTALDGSCRLIIIKNDKGEIIARRILRIAIDDKNQEGVLFAEKLYSKGTLPAPLQEAMTKFLKQRAKSLDMKIYQESTVGKANFNSINLKIYLRSSSLYYSDFFKQSSDRLILNSEGKTISPL